MRHFVIVAPSLFFVETGELDDDTEVLYANDLSVDLVARSVTPIGLGDLRGIRPKTFWLWFIRCALVAFNSPTRYRPDFPQHAALHMGR